MKYKYSKLAKEHYKSYTMEQLINMQSVYDCCTGKTTGSLLGLISTVILNPELDFDIKVYTQVSSFQYQGSGGIADCLDELINKLGLNYLIHSRKHATLVYKPYGYVTKDWVEVE